MKRLLILVMLVSISFSCPLFALDDNNDVLAVRGGEALEDIRLSALKAQVSDATDADAIRFVEQGDLSAYYFYLIKKYNKFYPNLPEKLANGQPDFWANFSKKGQGTLVLSNAVSNLIKQDSAKVSSAADAKTARDLSTRLSSLLQLLEKVDKKMFWHYAENILFLPLPGVSPAVNEPLIKFKAEVNALYKRSMFFAILAQRLEAQGLTDPKGIAYLELSLPESLAALPGLGAPALGIISPKIKASAIWALENYKAIFGKTNQIVVTPEITNLFNAEIPAYLKYSLSGRLPGVSSPAAGPVENLPLLRKALKASEAQKSLGLKGVITGVDFMAGTSANPAGISSEIVGGSENITALGNFRDIFTFKVEIIENLGVPLTIDRTARIIKIDSQIAQKDLNQIILLMLIYEALKSVRNNLGKFEINPLDEYVTLLTKGFDIFKQIGGDIRNLRTQLLTLQGLNILIEPLEGKRLDINGRVDFMFVVDTYLDAPRLFDDIARMYATTIAAA